MRLRIVFTLMALAHAAPLAAQEHQHPAGDPNRLGRVEFAVSCAPAVQPQFQTAVAMLHSFWFDAAEKAFNDIIAADPSCGMAYWGRAMTLMGNPMARVSPSPALLKDGLEAAQRARELVSAATHREQMYADAVLAYYRDHEKRNHAERMQAHEQALEALYRAHPEDMEAAIFYGRTVVANAPPADLTFARQLLGAEIMQPLFEKHPQHPGLAHYLIHAYDAPQLAEKGSKAAFAYAGIAPDAPHALHMPSHIFTRLGYWDESIETNARSARAEPDSNAAVHPNDYMVYAYLQQGRDEEARRVVERQVDQPNRFIATILSYNYVAMPARYALERSAWQEALALQVPVGAAPYVEAITRFARAIGAARAGRVAEARPELAALQSLHQKLKEQGDSYWTTVVDAQRMAAEAWVRHASGDAGAALELARAAADLEETVEKHPVTPGPILPARELLGDMLLELGQPAEALAAYEQTLVREPRRTRSLYGAARAAEAAGRREVAQAHYRAILDVMAKGDPSRPELRAARRALGTS